MAIGQPRGRRRVEIRPCRRAGAESLASCASTHCAWTAPDSSATVAIVASAVRCAFIVDPPRVSYLPGAANTFLYAAASVADGIISIRSVFGGISRSGSLLRATHGFV